VSSFFNTEYINEVAEQQRKKAFMRTKHLKLPAIKRPSSKSSRTNTSAKQEFKYAEEDINYKDMIRKFIGHHRDIQMKKQLKNNIGRLVKIDFNELERKNLKNQLIVRNADKYHDSTNLHELMKTEEFDTTFKTKPDLLSEASLSDQDWLARMFKKIDQFEDNISKNK